MSGLDGTVDVAGHKEKKWVVVAVALGGAVVAYYVYRQHQASAAAASSSSSGTVTDPSTGAQYPAAGTDAVTGMTYGQEIGQYGSVAAAESAAQYGQSSFLGNSGDLYGTGYTAANYSTGTYGATITVAGSVYTSNSAWAQAATAGLQDIGYTGTDVAAALGSYLTGTPVTSAQAAIVQAAIAEYGPPPVGSFQVITQPSGNTSPASLVAVPDVQGDSLAAAQAAVQAAGLVYSGPSSGSMVATQSPAAGTQVHPGTTVTVTADKAAPAPSPAPKPGSPLPPKPGSPPPPPRGLAVSGAGSDHLDVHWDAAPGATAYQVQATYQSRTVQSFTVHGTSAVIGGLTPDHTYGVHVSSAGPGGTSSPAATWAKTPR